MDRKEAWLQVSAGQGPAECAWAVPRVAEKIRDAAAAAGIDAKTIAIQPGPQSGTALSVLLSLSASVELGPFLAAWRGTVQWIARSPFRPEHKRKNWFVAVDALEPVTESHVDVSSVRFETMRASGPGGQHVNRTESAVRVTHLSTGLQASASEERSQHRNRKLALARLAVRLSDQQAQRHSDASRARWKAHHDLERGNPVQIFRED